MAEKGPMLEVIEQAKRQGWQHEVSSGGHHKLKPPNGGVPVITSLSPGDTRAFKNFLAAMRRSGFKDPDAREELMEKRRVRGVKSLLREYFREHPDSVFNMDELKLVVKARLPEASHNATNAAMSSLHGNGEVVRIGLGQYKLAQQREASMELPAATSPVPPPAPPPQDEPESEVGQLLEDFLDIVSRIERLLRKHQAIERKNAELRKLLLGE